MSKNLQCPICGAPTRVYMGNARKDRLCARHADMLKAGDIYYGDDGRYYETNFEDFDNFDEDFEDIDTDSKIQCLLCGENSGGYHFCRRCYRAYSSKSITLVLKNCKQAEILDEYGNKQYKCENGFFVRSTQEKIIADELFKRSVRCIYEQTLCYKKENGEIGELHPDFYLPDYDLYIEHWGFSQKDPDYLRTKTYKEDIYESLGKTVVGTTADDIKDITVAIDKILLQYEDREKQKIRPQKNKPQKKKSKNELIDDDLPF